MSAPGPGADCIFCGIVAGEIPARILGEARRALAFADIAPVAPTHALVVPREHITDAAALGAAHGELLAEMAALAREVAERAGVAASGYRLVFNVGDDAGNSVPHLHLHVIGGRALAWPPG